MSDLIGTTRSIALNASNAWPMDLASNIVGTFLLIVAPAVEILLYSPENAEVRAVSQAAERYDIGGGPRG